jgi:hypothetical protein
MSYKNILSIIPTSLPTFRLVNRLAGVYLKRHKEYSEFMALPISIGIK